MDLREAIERRLREHGRGYAFTRKDLIDMASSGTLGRILARLVEDHAIETALGMEPSENAESLNDRHYWVLSQLAQDVKLTKHHVMAQYGFSERSAKRILSALTKRGLIEFCPDPRPGFYKLCNPELLQNVDLDLVFAPQDVEHERYDQRPPTTAGEPLPGGNAITVQSPTSVPST